MEKILRHPVILYLLVAITSIVAALILYRAGSLASVYSDGNNYLGFGFQAGGALAGFIIILMLSVRVLRQLKEFDLKEVANSTMSMKFHLEGVPVEFGRNETYIGRIDIFDEESGEKKSLTVKEFRWENRALTVDVAEIKKSHLVAIEVRDGNGRSWTRDYFYARSRTETLELNAN